MLVGLLTGNPPKLETFAAWNRTHKRRERDIMCIYIYIYG